MLLEPQVLLILSGAIPISVALLRAWRFTQRPNVAPVLGTWRFLTLLMALFVVGYLGSVALLVTGRWQVLASLTSLIFAAGGVYVLLSVVIAERLATSLLDDSDRLEKVVEARTGELAAARHQAENASQAKSRHLAQMSHELRTPLNSVVGFTNILRKNRGGNLDPKQLLYLERIFDNSKRLLSLVNDLLDLSKIEEGHVETVLEDLVLTDVLNEVLGQFGAQVQEDDQVKLLLEAPEGVGSLHTDRGKLFQILVNLVGNALKFTETGSVRVRVAVGAETRRPLRIDVVDTGLGIAPDKLETIFEPFRQADSDIAQQFGGTGLGLSITRSLCHLLGWTLSARSDGSSGSTFSITLVANPDEPIEEPRRRADSNEVIPLTDLHIEKTMRRDLDGASALVVGGGSGVAQEIRRFGMTVLTAEDGDEALASAPGLDPDLWIIDTTGDRDRQLVETLCQDPELVRCPILVIADREVEVPEGALRLVPPATPVRLLGYLWKLRVGALSGNSPDLESGEIETVLKSPTWPPPESGAGSSGEPLG